MKKKKVKFLFHPKEQDLYAVFPVAFQHESDNMLVPCYSHVGQHSHCSGAYMNKSRPATKSEYSALKKELESLGYNLEILK